MKTLLKNPTCYYNLNNGLKPNKETENNPKEANFMKLWIKIREM